MAENDVHGRPNIGVTGMKDGRANTVVAVGQITHNYGPKEQANVCSQCKRKIKKIENEGDDIWSLIKKQERLFSTSRGFLEAKKTLEEKRVVVITGAPDEGKTTLAVQLCATFTRQGFSASYYINSEKVMLSSIGDKNSVTLFDNMFEELNEVTWQILCKIQEQVDTKEPTCLFIIVCQLFDKKKAELQNALQLLKDEYVVNISNINCSDETQTWRERYKVLQNMKTFLNEQEKIKIAQCKPFLIGFVGMCRFYDTAIQISRISYPQAFYFNQFNTIMERDLDKAALFIFLIYCEGKIDFSKRPGPNMQSKLRAVNDIVCGITFDILQNEVRCLTGTYLKCKEDGITEFTYPVLYDSCVAAVIAVYPQYIWEHCKMIFRDDDNTDVRFVKREDEATERTGDADKYKNLTSQESTIIIPKSTVNLMADHLANMLKSRHFCDVLKTPLLENEGFRESLFNVLDTDLPRLMKKTDKEKGGNFLFWSAVTGNEPLISHVLNLPDLSTSELNQSIITCAEMNSVAALDNLQMSAKDCSRMDLNFSVDLKIADETPLMIASAHGHDAMVNRLLTMGADPSVADTNGRTCVHLAAVRDDLDTYKTLSKRVPKEILDTKDDNGFTPNMVAFAKKGAIFEHLEHHYPQSHPTGVADKAEEENMEIQKLSELAISNQDTEHIQLACMNDSAIEISIRLSKGTLEINETCSNGNTPVMIAAYYGSQKVFELLMNERGCNMSVVNDYGCNILHNACIGGNEDIVQRIMQFSEQNFVDLNLRNKKGRTPVMEAAYMGHTFAFNLLVSKGCVISGQDCDVSTILHIACMGGNYSIIEHILSWNIAATNSRNCRGKTPLEIASENGHHEVVELLKSYDLQRHQGVLDRYKKEEAERSPHKMAAPTPPDEKGERQGGSAKISQTDHVKPDEKVEEIVHTITDLVSKVSHQLACPAMTLHRDRVHEWLDVSEDGQELVNWRESGHHSDQFQWYFGTCSRLPIPLPPSPSTLTAPTYWETDTRVQLKSEVSGWWPLLQMGVSEEGQVDTECWVGDQSRGWGVRVTDCHKHPGYCTKVWSEGRQCGVCLTDTLTDTPGTDVSLKYGAVVDIGRGRLAFIDLNRRTVLHRFDVKIRESLRPMFGVWPGSDECDVTMKLISGREITMDDNKKSLIVKALYSQ